MTRLTIFLEKKTRQVRKSISAAAYEKINTRW